jgi:hypothetical protein
LRSNRGRHQRLKTNSGSSYRSSYYHRKCREEAALP